jgi:single-stranded-DNA-specific exonuclease
MKWSLRSFDSAAADALALASGVPLTIARLLVQRGIHDPEQAHKYLHPKLADLHPPGQMLGLNTAIERIERAIAMQEVILIYGDYDVDGTTAIVILKTCIELLGGKTEFHVPHRIRDGYGMKTGVIEAAGQSGVGLVISVDTGIRAFAAAETARRVGLDLIVTDHHLPESAQGVPKALAVLNPNQDGCDYPCKDLCGAGVAFKLAQELLTRAGRERLLPSFLKMVAIATIADAVPLIGENRTIARLGLEGLRRPVNGGLRALMSVAQLGGEHHPITATEIAFRLAPRINAAGRMDIARDVIDLFTSTDGTLQSDLARKLNDLNLQRQSEEQRIIDAIVARLDTEKDFQDTHCIVIDGDGWHRGVIGIAATRVVEKTGRPALVISRDLDSGEAHGSGRSIPAFHLLAALESEDCRRLFTRFGGHAHAVGFSLPSDRIPDLRAALERYGRNRLTADDFIPRLEIDAELSLAEISPALVDDLRMLEPFGMGNREPVFLAHNVRLLQPPAILKEKHVKLRVADHNATQLRPYDALGWRMATSIRQAGLLVGDLLDIAFTLEENRHSEFGGIQLVMRDIRPAVKAAVNSAD